MATRTVTDNSEFVTELAAAIAGDVIEFSGDSFTQLTINGKSVGGAGLTFSSANASAKVPSILLAGTNSGLKFDSVNFQMTGWPRAYDACLQFGTTTTSGLIVDGCTFRHGYGASQLAIDPTADYDEYERVDHVENATTTSQRFTINWENNAMDYGQVFIFNHGDEDVYVAVGDSSVTATSGDLTVTPSQEYGRITGLDPTTDTHFAILSSSGTQEVNVRAEIGLIRYLADAFKASGSTSLTGGLTITNNDFSDLNYAIKAFGVPQGEILIADNVSENIYTDLIALSPGDGYRVRVLRNRLAVPFARSGIAEDLSGDAGDPHGDFLQMYGNGLHTIGPVISAGNTVWKHSLRSGVHSQGHFITDNDTSPGYEDFISIGDIITGGSTNGINFGEGSYPVDGALVYGATCVHHSDITINTQMRTWSTETGPVVVRDSVIAGFIKEDGKQIVRNSANLLDATDADDYFDSYTDFQTAETRSEVEAALTTVGDYSSIGAVAVRAAAIDFATSDYDAVVDWTEVPSGVGWEDATDQELSATVTTGLSKVINPSDDLDVVPGAGVEWRSVDTDGTTEVTAWTSSSGTIDQGQYLQCRFTASASPQTTVTPTLTVNGFNEAPTATTMSTLTDPFIMNDAFFADTSNVPANTTVAEWEVKFSLPTIANCYLMGQVSGGVLRIASSQLNMLTFEDSAGTAVASGSVNPSVSADTVYTANVKFDLDNDELTLTVDGVEIEVVTVAANTGTLQTTRALVFGSGTNSGAGNNLLPSDAEVEYFKVWLTTSSVRTLHKEISVAALGSIANINSDPWANGTVLDGGDSNSAPTDIALSASTIDEGNSIGDVIGTLSATDADEGDSHTFALVSGTGDTDNASFTIVGDELRAGEVFDYETKSSYSIRVNASDGTDGFAKALTITVVDVDEVPPDAVQDAFALLEGGTLNLNLATNDSDGGSGLDLTSITITTAPQNGSIVVNDNGTVDYTHDDSETTSDSFEYTIADNAGSVSDPAEVTLTIIPVDDTAPTIESAAINADGDELTVVFTESVTGSSVPTLSVDAIVATYSSGSGTDTIVYSLDRIAYDTDTITLAYASADFVDDADNALADVSGVSVTNGSTVPAMTLSDTDLAAINSLITTALGNVPSATEIREEMDSNSTKLKVAAAGAAGSVAVTDNEDGTLTLSFKDTDGTTEVANTTYTTETGARTRNS